MASDSFEPGFAPDLPATTDFEIGTPPTATEIAAILSDPVHARWNAASLRGSHAFVTYAFAQNVASYDSAASRPGFAAMTAAQQASVRVALDKWSAVSGLVFLEVPDARPSDLRFGLHNFSSTTYSWASGYGYGPYVDPAFAYRSPIGGDVWINTVASTYTNDNALSGDRAQHVLVHEIGHAIGLKHPFDGSPTLPTADDNMSITVMSYTGDASKSVQPQVLDIAAVQSLYGALKPGYFWDYVNLTLTIYGQAGAETLNGSEVNDIVAASGGADIVRGGGGNDWLFGGDGADSVYGEVGDDVVYGDIFSESAADLLDGGPGADIVIGGLGADTLFGRAGNDWLFGSGGDDAGYGNEGDDVFYGDLFAGEVGNDIGEGGAGADILIGGPGIDTLYGGFLLGGYDSGNDWLFGSDGGDFLFGGAGNDVLYGDLFAGESGPDTLDAGDGDDFLWGGPGDDTLIGGFGSDQYWLGTGRDTISIPSLGQLTREIAYEFTPGAGGDVIDLRGAGYSAYASNFTGFRSAYLRDGAAGAVVDFDGSGSQYELTLAGVTVAQLTAANFLF